jgi:hypothetical protein
MNNMSLATNGERRARKILRNHFTNVRFHNINTAPFDYTGIDKLTGDRVAIEVKTVKKETGKIAHIETEAMNRKLNFLNETNRKGIVLVIIINGSTHFYFSRLKQHISKGDLVDATI